MTLFNNHFYESFITIVGISFMTEILISENEIFAEVNPFFKDEALFWFYKVDFYKKHSTTIRNSRPKNPDMDWETTNAFQMTKGILSDLKTPKESIENTEHFFYKKRIVITGDFEKFNMRNDMAKLLYDVGADINTSISKKTDFVIIGKNAGPKKLEKISELNIKTISEEDFYSIFEIL